MSNSIYLQEDLQKFVYSYDYCENYFCESSSQFLYYLAASKNCGLLMLIGKLLEKEEVKPDQEKLRNYFLAKRMIQNFYDIKVSITYPPADEAVAFVSKMIDHAKKIVKEPESVLPFVFLYAERFVNIFEAYDGSFSNYYAILEESYESFCLNYFYSIFYQRLSTLDGF